MSVKPVDPSLLIDQFRNEASDQEDQIRVPYRDAFNSRNWECVYKAEAIIKEFEGKLSLEEISAKVKDVLTQCCEKNRRFLSEYQKSENLVHSQQNQHSDADKKLKGAVLDSADFYLTLTGATVGAIAGERLADKMVTAQPAPPPAPKLINPNVLLKDPKQIRSEFNSLGTPAAPEPSTPAPRMTVEQYRAAQKKILDQLINKIAQPQIPSSAAPEPSTPPFRMTVEQYGVAQQKAVEQLANPPAAAVKSPELQKFIQKATENEKVKTEYYKLRTEQNAAAKESGKTFLKNLSKGAARAGGAVLGGTVLGGAVHAAVIIGEKLLEKTPETTEVK
jgi:hypothetical protein